MPAQIQHVIGAGISPQATRALVGGQFTEGGLTASGTTKGTALLLPASRNYISICSSGKAVGLPGSLQQGDTIEVFNGGLNTLVVFTNGATETITNTTANAGFSVATMRSAQFTKVTSTLFMVNYSA